MLSDFGEVLENASLENYNTYGIKTSCKYLVKPKSLDDLQRVMVYLKENNFNYYVLGKGSNVILPDHLFNGFIISLENLNKINFEQNLVTCEAGALLGTLVKEAIEHNLSGFEYLFGIPGTVGGALYGNAGAYNHSIYDCLESITILKDNDIKTLKKSDIKIDYRYTEFKETKDIIVAATFKLEFSDKESLHEIIKNIGEKRQNNLPLQYKNAGSVFKNPTGDFAGRLIEESNLKGYAVGGAKVSEKHANFIVNTGNMTSKDVKELIKHIQKVVEEKFKIKLELEQIIIDWD